jgi:flagellar hook protein FlgE
MSFQQALSGLNVSSKALEAIGNNVANANTVGYKASNVQFADVFASSLSGGGAGQVGIGASVAGIAQQFTQGNITTSNNPLDLAINGNGMFRLQTGPTSGTVSYTRNGQYSVDKDGYIVNPAGQYLTGYAADATGAIVPGNFVALQMNTSNIPPATTKASQVLLNLDSRSTVPTSGATRGTLTGDSSIATSNNIVATGSNTFDITVDGVVRTGVSVPAGTYTNASLAAAMTTAINDAFGGAAAVDVTLTATNQLRITSRSQGTVGSQGAGSTVSITNVRGGLNLNGGTVVAADATTAGSITSTNPIPDGMVIIAGVNDRLNLTVGATAVTCTLTPGTYNTREDVRAAVQAAINDQSLVLGGAGLATPIATTNVSGVLIITAGAVNESVSLTAGNPTGGNIAGVNFGGIDVAVPPASGFAPVAAAGVDTFNASNTLTYTASTAQTVYDTKGNPHNLTMYFVKTSQLTPYSSWQIYTTLDNAQQTGPLLMNFTDTGTLANVAGLTNNQLSQTFTLTNGAQPLNFTVDFTGTTEYGIAFGVNQLIQDGYTSGRLSGLSVGGDGVVQGRYSNGKSRNMGQLVLANFNNPNGLNSLGGNLWAETAESGQPIPGTPGQGSLGAIQAGSVEEANVDLTAELVNMITQQRVYQANAQTIKTMDQVLQTLVNMR